MAGAPEAARQHLLEDGDVTRRVRSRVVHRAPRPVDRLWVAPGALFLFGVLALELYATLR